MKVRARSAFGVNLCHCAHELLEGNTSVPILVSIRDDLIHLRRSEALSHRCSHLLELSRPEDSLSVEVKGLEEALERCFGAARVIEAEDAEEGAEVHFSFVS